MIDDELLSFLWFLSSGGGEVKDKFGCGFDCLLVARTWGKGNKTRTIHDDDEVEIESKREGENIVLLFLPLHIIHLVCHQIKNRDIFA